MNNFQFYNPVKIIFGKGQIATLAHQVPKDARILLTYGGGSIFKNGVYDQVKAAGIADAFTHVIEQYITYPVNAVTTHALAEAILLTLTKEEPKMMENPSDYDAALLVP